MVKADKMCRLEHLPPRSDHYEVPDFFYVLDARPDILNWNYRGQSAHEFIQEFEQYEGTGQFKKSMDVAFLWWKTIANEEEYGTRAASIDRAFNVWTKSIEQSSLPFDYVQYIRDLVTYKEECKRFQRDLAVKVDVTTM